MRAIGKIKDEELSIFDLLSSSNFVEFGRRPVFLNNESHLYFSPKLKNSMNLRFYHLD